MNEESDPRSAGAAAPLDGVQQSVYSDLQYVSLQVDGKAYGGWYRVLPDGRLELLALANMHCERRPERTPVEQARGMLADFVRAARKGGRAGTDAPAAPASSAGDEQSKSATTIGDLLYADKTKSRVPEDDWIALIRSIAAGDPLALDQLFERTHRIVLTLMMRLLGSREVAEELTLNVFHDVWRQASRFDAAEAPVLAWLLNQARLLAIERLQLEQYDKNQGADVNESGGRLRDAASALSANERGLIGTSELTETLRKRLAMRIAAQMGTEPTLPAQHQWTEPAWEQVAPGISCKLLATDSENDRVSMLVRLGPGVEYPPHTHAGCEELHLLEGELWIEDRKLHPGDYNRAERGSADQRVWSETGCTCVLITSTRDVIGQAGGSQS